MGGARDALGLPVREEEGLEGPGVMDEVTGTRDALGPVGKLAPGFEGRRLAFPALEPERVFDVEEMGGRERSMRGRGVDGVAALEGPAGA